MLSAMRQYFTFTHRALSLLACVAVLAFTAPAQADELFDQADVLAIQLDYPARQLIREARNPKPLPATLSYTGRGGERVTIALEVEVRGNKRRETCAASPPLRLLFKGKAVEGTMFEGQKDLKLVTQCKRASWYADYVRLEHKAYRIFEQVTPLSFRTRMLEITYRDTDDNDAARTEPAFLIEDISDVAKRNQRKRVRREQISVSDLDPAYAALSAVFQYLIANTDWSIQKPSAGDDECCHNGKPVGPADGAGAVAVVPYDFDSAGLVNTDYAIPAESLKVRSVTSRIYRGFCSSNDQIPQAIAAFNEQRAAIEALFTAGDLGAKSQKAATKFVGRFFDLIGDENQVRKKILDKCR
ncbi:MAG: hypothetical protein H6978_15725 [Gammaproteobacteria bacterium]|nr:hypothetical protein [Gammaproteobacteria bacterium]